MQTKLEVTQFCMFFSVHVDYLFYWQVEIRCLRHDHHVFMHKIRKSFYCSIMSSIFVGLKNHCSSFSPTTSFSVPAESDTLGWQEYLYLLFWCLKKTLKFFCHVFKKHAQSSIKKKRLCNSAMLQMTNIISLISNENRILLVLMW